MIIFPDYNSQEPGPEKFDFLLFLTTGRDSLLLCFSSTFSSLSRVGSFPAPSIRVDSQWGQQERISLKCVRVSPFMGVFFQKSNKGKNVGKNKGNP